MNWELLSKSIKEQFTTLQDGFEYTLTEWEVFPLGAVCRCTVYFQGREICSVPAVLSKKEWNNGDPDINLLSQLLHNLLESANDLALTILGWPPYDDPTLRKELGLK